MLSTLQYHYRLNSAGCKKYHSEHKAYNSSNEKRVISVFQLEWKIKITKALSSKENWQIKGTKNKIFMAHIVKWKVNNLRWTIMWEIALFLKSKKANLTNTHIHIPASWACSYMYMCTNMQVMVDVQQCWGIDIFSPILTFKIFSSETVKLTSTALYEEGWFFFSSWVQPRNEDWMRECSLTALQFSTTLCSESPITYLFLDFYTTKK